MLNPIHAIKQLYQLVPAANQSHGISREVVEQHESELGIQLPPMLYHYLIELGNVDRINTSYHQFVQLPFERLGEYMVIGKTCDDDGIWGIHTDDLSQHNPMVQMSRNFDALEQDEVYWFDALPLSEFLLAQAIINGANAGLVHHAQIYDFDGLAIPEALGDRLETLATEIIELRQPHERYFQVDDYSVVMMLGSDGDTPNAFLIGSDVSELFNHYIQALAIGFEHP